jgi:hypothetical protein
LDEAVEVFLMMRDVRLVVHGEQSLFSSGDLVADAIGLGFERPLRFPHDEVKRPHRKQERCGDAAKDDEEESQVCVLPVPV